VDLFLDPDAPHGVTRSLYDQLREAITTGRLGVGERLPTSREVATELGVSRHTVTTVYGRLSAEGFVAGRAGDGTFVSPMGANGANGGAGEPGPTALAVVPELATPFLWPDADALPPTRYDLRPGPPDASMFPLVDWRRCVTGALQTPPGGYGPSGGHPSLQRALAQWIGRSRGVVAAPDQVVVTSGAQQAIHVVIRLLVRPGDVVAVEDPGYPPVRQLCRAMGIAVAPVPVDADGLVVDQIPTRARVVYTTPSHQSPTGVAMSLARRRQLLEFAASHDVAVVEDDYDSEYRYADRPLEPLYRLDRSGRVIYVGTFSKVLSPTLRLGFMVLPGPLVTPAVAVRRLMDWQPPAVQQDALLRFIGDGLLARHLRRTRKAYAERHRLISGFLREAELDGRIATASAGIAGLHVTGFLPDGVDEQQVRKEAWGRGVAVSILRHYWAGNDRPGGLILGFGAIATRDVAPALAVLGDVLASARPH
jgi:GntR family transcriptional regulator/MocR family aminotransferase